MPFKNNSQLIDAMMFWSEDEEQCEQEKEE